MNLEQEMPVKWVQRVDLHWIEENYYVFQSAVRNVFDEIGRGAVAVDVTMPPVDGGHPFAYWPQSYLEEHADDETNRLVREYLPREELVVILLKTGRRFDAYRVGPALF